MFYSVKEFVAKRALRKGRAEGMLAERERINREVAERGVQLSQEMAKILAGDGG